MVAGDIVSEINGLVGVWTNFQPAATIEIAVTGVSTLLRMTNGVVNSDAADTTLQIFQTRMLIDNSIYLAFHGSFTGSGWTGIQIK